MEVLEYCFHQVVILYNNTCGVMLQVAVEVFGLVQQLLPSVAVLNQKYAPPAFNPNQSTDSTTGNQPEQGLSACTTSNHYAVVESDHPYKPASVTHYKVSTISKCTCCFLRA